MCWGWGWRACLQSMSGRPRVVVVGIGTGMVVDESVGTVRAVEIEGGRPLVGAGPRISVEGGFTQTRTWTRTPPMTWSSMWQRCPFVVGGAVRVVGAIGRVVGGADLVVGGARSRSGVVLVGLPPGRVAPALPALPGGPVPDGSPPPGGPAPSGAEPFPPVPPVVPLPVGGVEGPPAGLVAVGGDTDEAVGGRVDGEAATPGGDGPRGGPATVGGGAVTSAAATSTVPAHTPPTARRNRQPTCSFLASRAACR